MSIVNFRIKDSEKNVLKPREWVNIRIRVEQFEISTSLKVNRKHWSSSRQRVKNSVEANYADDINIKLIDLESFVNKEYTISKANDKIISQRWLSDTSNNFFNRKTSEQTNADIYLIDRMVQYIDDKRSDNNPRTGVPRAERTFQDYQNKLNKLKEFEIKKSTKIKLIDVDLKFHRDFLDFLKKDKLITNNNTLKGYTDILKQVCLHAKKIGLKTNSEIEHNSFYTKPQKTFDFAFTLEEIEKIYNHVFETKSKLDRVRDWLIVGVWTGLRISDFLSLKPSDIDDGFITITNKKTDIPVIIPLHDNVKSILKKWGNKFPDTISDQKFNDYVKDVCKEVGMNEMTRGSKKVEIKNVDGVSVYRKKVGDYPKYELVSSHICRRTFATIHYGKIDTLTIMRITGHSTENQFIKYVKLPAKIYAERLKELWNKQREANINIY